jgi:capsular polysaccharide transport system permease protein
MKSSRTSWQVTRSVWLALFLREALARTTADRFAWFWMLAEPIAMVAVMVAIRSLLPGGDRLIIGAEFVPWLIYGLLTFYLFRENMMRGLGAIQANKGLFSYRQVLPIDPVLVRCFLEGMIKTIILLLFLMAGLLVGFSGLPDNPLLVMISWASMWLLGVSTGLVVSALSEMFREIGTLVRISSLPLMMTSGAIFPLNFLPYELQQWLLLNPIVHGVELMRLGFFEGYRSMDGISFVYLWFWIVAQTAFGLLLHIRYKQRLKAQ